jgi:outer membrane lipoprotein carrier protein
MFFFRISLLALLCVSSPVLAVEKTKRPAQKAFSLEKLQQSYKKNASLEADFLQEVYQASLARTKTSKGTLKLSKPNLVRWEIHEPEASVLVSNGRKVFYYTPDARGKGKGQVIQKKTTELEKQPLFRILTGASPLHREFKVVKMEVQPALTSGDKWTQITLKPLKEMGDISQVLLQVDGKYLIQELITENLSGNKTKITLQNQVLGAKLPPALFEFKPPADTEVLTN